jgi:hypothetical protein
MLAGDIFASENNGVLGGAANAADFARIESITGFGFAGSQDELSVQSEWFLDCCFQRSA